MKLSGRDAARFAAKPDLSLCGVLIYGADGVEVAERRKRIADRILGDDPERDLRLTRIAAADARRDPAALTDAMRAQGFFAAGRQVTLVEDAADGAAPAIAQALEGATVDDAFLIVTAGALPARSKLRALFEKNAAVAAAPCYDEPLGREDIARALGEAGLRDLSPDAQAAVEGVARGSEPAAFRDFVARLALYTLDAGGKASPEDVAAIAPGAADADVDAALDAVADGRADAVGPLLSRLAAQGAAPTGVAIAAQRYFRQIHKVAAESDGGAIDAAVGRLRPPVYGPRRDALIRRCRAWPTPRAEGALKLLLETDAALRGGMEGAGFALLERAFLKLALSKRPGGR